MPSISELSSNGEQFVKVTGRRQTGNGLWVHEGEVVVYSPSDKVTSANVNGQLHHVQEQLQQHASSAQMERRRNAPRMNITNHDSKKFPRVVRAPLRLPK